MYISYNIQVAKTKDAEDADGQGDYTLHEHTGAAACIQVQHSQRSPPEHGERRGENGQASLSHCITSRLSQDQERAGGGGGVMCEFRMWEKLLKRT